MLGDRITFVVLPFAVLEAGGGVTEVGFVAAAQTLPFLVFSLLAGVWADRLDRRRIMIASDVVRLVCQAHGGRAADQRRGRAVAPGGPRPSSTARATRSSRPRSIGLMPQIVPRRAPAVGQRAARPRPLERARARPGAGRPAGRDRPGPAPRCWSTPATFARQRRVPAAPAPARRSNAWTRWPEPEHDLLAGLRDGWHEVRSRPVGDAAARWRWPSTTWSCCRRSSCSGPVLADREFGGAAGLGADHRRVRAGRDRRRRASCCAGGRARRCAPRPLCLVVGSCQAAIIGSGLPVAAIAGLELLAGDLRHVLLHALGDLDAGAHPRARRSRGSRSYDMLDQRRPDAGRQC